MSTLQDPQVFEWQGGFTTEGKQQRRLSGLPVSLRQSLKGWRIEGRIQNEGGIRGRVAHYSTDSFICDSWNATHDPSRDADIRDAPGDWAHQSTTDAGWRSASQSLIGEDDQRSTEPSRLKSWADIKHGIWWHDRAVCLALAEAVDHVVQTGDSGKIVIVAADTNKAVVLATTKMEQLATSETRVQTTRSDFQEWMF